MDKILHQPLGGNEMPRFRRHRHHAPTSPCADRCRPGCCLRWRCRWTSALRSPRHPLGPARHPHRIGDDPPVQTGYRAPPFDSLSVAVSVDVSINTFNLSKPVRIIEEAYDNILEHNVIPHDTGGDHTITLPILRAIHKKHGRCGLVHIDAHADVNDHMFGEKIAHAPRSVALSRKVCSIAIEWCRSVLRARVTPPTTSLSRDQGFRVVQAKSAGTVAGTADG